METIQEAKPVETPEAPKPDLAPLVDEFADLRSQLTAARQKQEQIALPYKDAIREQERLWSEASAPYVHEEYRILARMKELEAQILRGTAGLEQAFVAGSKATAVVKRSFARKIDAEGVWNALDREGKLDHYGFLFKKSITVKDFETARKQPLFLKDAEAYVETSVRSETVEVV